jgi:hypothetical protein
MFERRWLLGGVGMGVGVTAMAALCVALYVNWYSLSYWYRHERHAANVKVSVSPGNPICGTRPIAIRIENNSSRAIEHTDWGLSATVKGYSSNLVAHHHSSKTDKIIEPGDALWQCFPWPDFIFQKPTPEEEKKILDLNWRVVSPRFKFAD